MVNNSAALRKSSTVKIQRYTNRRKVGNSFYSVCYIQECYQVHRKNTSMDTVENIQLDKIHHGLDLDSE